MENNLISNGDFNASGGFTTDYRLLPLPQGAGTVAVLTATPGGWGLGSSTAHGGWNDKFLMVDGAQDESKAFWKQKVELKQGVSYEFSFWVIANDNVGVKLQVDEGDVGKTMVTEAGAGWKQVSMQFTAQKSGTVELKLRDTLTKLNLNDFGIDDLRLTQVTPDVANLIINGDFNASGGFTTDYKLQTQVQGAGTVAVVTAPPKGWGLGSTMGHGGEGDKFLMVDGAQDESKAFWKQVAELVGGKVYVLKLWVTANDNVDVQLQINGENVGKPMTTEAGTGWKQVSVQFTAQQSGATTLALIDKATHLIRNDLAIDDLSLTLVTPDVPNLISNGDFNAPGGFTTDYKLQAQVQGPGTAAVVTAAPQGWLRGSSTGHGGQGDKFLMVDGAQDESKAFWKHLVPLKQGEWYEFSFWVNANDDVELQLQADGGDVGKTMGTQAGAGWMQVSTQFTAQKSGTVELKLRDKSTKLTLNDFGIDDLRLTLVTPDVVNLISNWDFNASGGFTTDYKLQTQVQGAGTVAVVTAPPKGWGLGSSTGHGGDGDKFLMVDGAQDARKVFWKQWVSLKQGEIYELSFWVIANDKVDLQMQADGGDVGKTMVTEAGAGWKQVSMQFTAQKSGTVELGMRDKSTQLAFNDFGIDDIRLTHADQTLNLRQADGLVAENTIYTSVAPILTGTPVGQVTYNLGGADAGLFTINHNTGVVSMMHRDFEDPLDNGQNNIYDYILIASDSNGNTASKAVQVSVYNVNEAPISINLVGNRIDENREVGTGVRIGRLNVDDEDVSGNNNILSLSGADAVSFQIREDFLYFVGKSPNYETKSEYLIRITSTDGNLVTSGNYRVFVNDLVEAPITIIGVPNTITDNAAVGTVNINAVHDSFGNQGNNFLNPNGYDSVI